MSDMLKKIRESVNVSLYQKLLQILGGYSIDIPATGVDNLFDTAAESGKKIMPKDKKAVAILTWLLSCGAPSQVVQKLLNLRFSDLPVEIRPITKAGRKHQTALFGRGRKISDQIKDLIDFEGSGKKGQWVDIDGEKVELIDISSEDKKDAKRP